MKRKFFFASLIFVAVSGIYVMAGCSKNDTISIPSESSSSKTNQTEFKLIAEISTDSTFSRIELLDLGNVYESYWNKRYFENGQFQYDLNYYSNVLDTRFELINCDENAIVFETEEGDTVTIYNIEDAGTTVSFDMLRDDNKVVHFKVMSDLKFDFVNSLLLATHLNDSKQIITGTAIAIISAVIASAALTVSVISLVKSIRDRNCDIIKNNGKTLCNCFDCGIWEGDCCVKCIKTREHKNCDHIGQVWGNGDDCNSH